jgi:hypothetical protein
VYQTFLDLYHRHVAAAYDRQMRLNDYLRTYAAGNEWNYDIGTATLTIGTGVSFQAPLLGSYTQESNCWLWAWANRELRLPSSSQSLQNEVCRLGLSLGHPVFTAMEPIRCEEVLPQELLGSVGYVFGLIIAGELNYDAYYPINFEGGQAVALIRDFRLRVVEPYPVQRIVSLFRQVIGGCPIPDQQTAFLAYVEAYQLQAVVDEQEVSVLLNGREVLTARFDERNQLISLDEGQNLLPG